MNAERSPKNQLLTAWAMRALSGGVPMEQVKASMKRVGRKTVAEIRAFVKSQRK